MAKLTSARVSGIKTGYWSPAKKDDLVQRLGAIEHQGPRLLDRVCAERCIWHSVNPKKDHICDECPVTALRGLMG